MSLDDARPPVLSKAKLRSSTSSSFFRSNSAGLPKVFTKTLLVTNKDPSGRWIKGEQTGGVQEAMTVMLHLH